MNAAHLHLMVNHLPLFAVLFAGGFLAFGLWRKQNVLINAGLVLAVVAGLGAFTAARTGEAAEEVVEGLALVSEQTIESHEEAAELAMVSAIVLGALALVALAVPTRLAAVKRATTYGALALSLVTFGLVAQTANLGGMIRHPEINDASATLPYGEVGEDESEGIEH